MGNVSHQPVSCTCGVGIGQICCIVSCIKGDMVPSMNIYPQESVISYAAYWQTQPSVFRVTLNSQYFTKNSNMSVFPLLSLTWNTCCNILVYIRSVNTQGFGGFSFSTSRQRVRLAFIFVCNPKTLGVPAETINNLSTVQDVLV